MFYLSDHPEMLPAVTLCKESYIGKVSRVCHIYRKTYDITNYPAWGQNLMMSYIGKECSIASKLCRPLLHCSDLK